MTADNAIKQSFQIIPKNLGVVLLDVKSNKFTQEMNLEEVRKAHFDLLKKSAQDLFEKHDELSLERKFQKIFFKKEDAQTFNEIIFYVDELLYFLTKLPENPDYVFGVVCSAEANVGLVKLKTQELVRQIML